MDLDKLEEAVTLRRAILNHLSDISNLTSALADKQAAWDLLPDDVKAVFGKGDSPMVAAQRLNR